MSDQYTPSDDEFAAAADQVEADHKKKSFDFPQLAWTGLSVKQFGIYRAVGGVPKPLGTSMPMGNAVKAVAIDCWDDKNNRMRLCLPPEADLLEQSHLIHRVRALVLKVTYSKGPDGKTVTTPVYASSHPDIFNRVRYGGAPVEQYKYAKGLRGQNVWIMNVIDRSQMDWHRSHKHTMLLTKNLFISDKYPNGIADTGVPSYGLDSLFSTLWKNYSSWENYDFALRRTGNTSPAYILYNASEYASKQVRDLPENLWPIVSTAPLTEEERSWERYDINELFTHNDIKIRDRLGGLLKQIDGAFATHFWEEAQANAEAEEKRNEQYAKDHPAAAQTGSSAGMASAPTTSAQPAAAPAQPTAPAAQPAAAQPAAAPAQPATQPATRSVAGATRAVAGDIPNCNLVFGWKDMTPQTKALFDRIDAVGGKITSISYKPEAGGTLGCPTCGIQSPTTFMQCPGCGAIFQAAQ